MAHPRRFRFGIQLTTAPSGGAWAETARRAESGGWSSLMVPDHFGDQLAPGPALAAAAAATTDLRIGALVYDNDFRHPVVLAKEAATLDVLSGGRMELGLGAGWMATDYEQSGIPYEAAGLRVDRMAEAIAVIKGLFADGPLTHAGAHYRVTGLDGLPKPVQRPRLPLLVGGGGRRVLSIAGAEADIVGINPTLANGRVDADAARNGAPAETDRKLAWVRDAAGARYADLELTMLVFAVVVTGDRAGALEQMAPLFGLDPAGLDGYPHALIGSEEEIAEQLEAHRSRWDLSYWVVQGADAFAALTPVVARLTGR